LGACLGPWSQQIEVGVQGLLHLPHVGPLLLLQLSWGPFRDPLCCVNLAISFLPLHFLICKVGQQKACSGLYDEQRYPCTPPGQGQPCSFWWLQWWPVPQLYGCLAGPGRQHPIDASFSLLPRVPHERFLSLTSSLIWGYSVCLKKKGRLQRET
jgi:hypothetical protein